ncbi:molybdenum cofactor biosynthesis protein MoaE [Arenimonas composti]|uniref:Molybdopterin synthase catalytic subunit n=1 Tax=Arenimonas composti TR7-09 = DSM 18010 TaxID=1121013 RepID=A0A091BFV7_9GAMM|nr:molybdenum cofactor biosynthesis protein MoaE [Arenimonas composti]KFN50412.1 hypothetical protein P873_07045 [Arenimonas composti TR7-09 = DSM 18010]
MKRFALTDTALDTVALQAALQSPAAGAFASFEGRVRDHHAGRTVRALHYQAYPALADSEGEAILAEALSRFDILDARAVHRTGDLAIGDPAVWVGVIAAHRGPAFDACRWIIDALKERVPIWKRESYGDGSEAWQHPGAAQEVVDNK